MKQEKIQLSLSLDQLPPDLRTRLRRDQEILEILTHKEFSDKEMERFMNVVPENMPLSEIAKRPKKHLKGIMKSQRSRRLIASYNKNADQLEGDNPGADIYMVAGNTFCSGGVVKEGGAYAFAIPAHCLDNLSGNAVSVYLPNGSRRIINIDNNSWSHPNFAGSPSSEYDMALLFVSSFSAYEESIAIDICSTLPVQGEAMIAYGLGNYRVNPPGGADIENPSQLCNANTDMRQRKASIFVVGSGNDKGWNKWNNAGEFDADTSCPGDSGGAVTKVSNGCHAGVLSSIEYWVQSDLSCFFGSFCTYVQKSFWGTSATDTVRAEIIARGAVLPSNSPTIDPSPVPSRSPTNVPINAPTFRPTNNPTSRPSRGPNTSAPIIAPTNMPLRSVAPSVFLTSVPSAPSGVPSLGPTITSNATGGNNDSGLGGALGISAGCLFGIALCCGVRWWLRKSSTAREYHAPRETYIEAIAIELPAQDVEIGLQRQVVEARVLEVSPSTIQESKKVILSDQESARLDVLCRSFCALGHGRKVPSDYREYYNHNSAKYESSKRNELCLEKKEALKNKLKLAEVTNINLMQIVNHASDFITEILGCNASLIKDDKVQMSLTVLQKSIELIMRSDDCLTNLSVQEIVQGQQLVIRNSVADMSL